MGSSDSVLELSDATHVAPETKSAALSERIAS